MALQEYEIEKTRIQRQISEYQSKLEDKADKLHEKEQELEQMTQNIDRIGRVAQPFPLVNLRYSEWTNGSMSRTGLSPTDS